MAQGFPDLFQTGLPHADLDSRGVEGVMSSMDVHTVHTKIYF